MLQVAGANSGGADYESAVRDSFGHAGKNLGTREDLGRPDGGTRLAKRGIVRIHDAQVRAAEIAHRARRRSNIERIARRNENDAEPVEFAQSWQAPIL
jgi:hypothetical protein